MHTNKVLRHTIDINRIASNAIAQESMRRGDASDSPPSFLSPHAYQPRPSFFRRVLKWIFRQAKKIIRPILRRYRDFHNRLVTEQLNRIESRLGLIHEIAPQLKNLERHLSFQDVTSQRLSEIEKRLSAQLDLLHQIRTYSTILARRVHLGLGNDRVLVKTSVGYAFCYAHDVSVLTSLIDTGELELGTRLLIERILGPHSTFVDIGANIGLHTLASARAMKGQGKIIAFEPYGPSAELLKETIFLNNFQDIVEIHQAAVSSQAGRLLLHLGKISGHHSLYPLEGSLAQSQTTEVPVVVLSEVIAPETKIDLMKIDVEGAELEVLKGAVPLIQANPNMGIIVELGPSHLKRVGVKIEDWFKEFKSLNLTFQAIDPMSGELQPLSIPTLAEMESSNLLFARPESTIWAKACVKK